jgi:hypothetical protein
MHRSIMIHFAILFATLLTIPVKAQSPPSHLDLDWQAPRRWVHVDNVDPQKVQLFEGTRKTWLSELRQESRLLGDGRPLFWCAQSPDAYTYFTLYPFRSWADLDARADMAGHTKKVVGDEAVKAYDSCDDALIPPHYSQIWRRDKESDIVWSGTDSLTELSAAVGRLEFRWMDWGHSDDIEGIWKEIQAALASRRYPLACRVYTNSFGNDQGECILLWLAPDSAQYRDAPSIRTILAQGLGSEKSKEMMAMLDKYFPVQKSYEIKKRLDLSNLGK